VRQTGAAGTPSTLTGGLGVRAKPVYSQGFQSLAWSLVRSLPYDDAGRPDLRSPGRLLWWIARGQWTSLLNGMGWGVTWFVAQALMPATIGQAIDHGVVAHDLSALVLWTVAVLGLAATTALSGMLRHRAAVANWLMAAFRVIQVLGTHAARTGEALPRQIPTGEVVATVASDAQRIGGMYDVSARFAGAVASYVVVAIVLLRTSVPLGLVVLLGVPVVTMALGVLIRPLHHRQSAQREEVGRLTILGADTVAGLRVLRGIGGESVYRRRYAEQSGRVRDHGIQVARIQSVMDAAQVLLPGVFVVLITWLGARFAIEGRISPGQLVAAYGYAAFLVGPLATAVEMADRATRAYVGARRVIRVLSVQPSVKEATVTAPMPEPGADLVDTRSGLVVAPGRLTAVVSADPEESAALADRLGRFGAPDGVRLGGVSLSALPLGELRRRIVVSETDPRLFTGILRAELAGTDAGPVTAADLAAAIEVASAADAVDATPDGLDGQIEERGRSLSGGQRQRLALVRALLRDAETLVLVEPTSAVDAHTEARIGQRLRQARAGRSTVVMTSSPLLLDHADQVAFVEDGVVRATGTHDELLETSPEYRAVVLRGEEE
jgi:ABC-type bacteriocin/lantibiotic exporter with double-glycine peptidase domain